MTTHQDRTFDDLRNTVHEYARILRHRWRMALLGASLVCSIAFWISQYMPRKYSTTTLFERRDDAVLRNLVRSNSPYSFSQLKSSISLDMTGSRALAEAATNIGLIAPGTITSTEALSNDEQRQVERALGRYDLKATVRLVQNSLSLDTIELRCSSNDPTIASRFVIALRDNYIRRTRDRITEILSSTRDFFRDEVDNYNVQIKEANQILKDGFAKYPGIDPSDPSSAGRRLESLQTESLRLHQRKTELIAQIEAREKFLTSEFMTEPNPTNSPTETTVAQTRSAPPVLPETTSTIDKAIKDVEQQITDAILLKRMTKEHPTVKGLQRKLDNLKAVRAAASNQSDPPESAPEVVLPTPNERLQQQNPVLAGQRLRVELELDALRAQYAVATQHYEDANQRLSAFSVLYDKLSHSSDSMQQLQDQIEQNTATAAVWRGHLSQLERILAADSDDRGTQFALIEEPKENAHATSPQASAIFIVCLGCGLAAAALLIAIAELMDRSFRSTGQVARSLGLPILECIGLISTPRVRQRRLASRLFWTPALCVTVSALFITASLAYTSLEHPRLHCQAISKLDSILQSVGVPPTSLGRNLEE